MKKVFWFAFVLNICFYLESSAKCSDYSTAQQVVNAYRRGETDLDRDNDCFACESTFNVYVCGNTSVDRQMDDLRKKLADDLENTDEITIPDYGDVSVYGNTFKLGVKTINKKYPSIILGRGYGYYDCNNLTGYRKFDEVPLKIPMKPDYVYQMCKKHGFKPPMLSGR